MSLWYCLQIAFANLRANKLRSGLTMLGIVIGVSAVILMVGLLEGAASRITGEFSKLGSNLLIIAYAPDRKERREARVIEGLDLDDLRAVREQCDLVGGLSPELPVGAETVARSEGVEFEVAAFGVLPDYERIRSLRIERGRFVSPEDGDAWAKVCVLGADVADALFPERDALSRRAEIGGLSLTVVGVLARKGRSFTGEPDKNVYLPLATVQKRILGTRRVGTLYAEPVDPARIGDAKDQVWELLMRRYDNLPGFKVDGLDSVLSGIRRVTLVLTLLLGSIAGLAMLVSGVGIMNIMLVSVTERTREIGICKAVGAKRRDILAQFLIESATVSAAGGAAGIVLGTSAAYAVGFVSALIPALTDPDTGARGFAVAVPLGLLAGTFLFSAGVGIFFGIYPAVRASRLDPIEALRRD